MRFAPTIGAALAACYPFLWLCWPAGRTTKAVDLRLLDRQPDAAVTSLIPAVPCRSQNPPFPERVRLSPMKSARSNDTDCGMDQGFGATKRRPWRRMALQGLPSKAP